MRNKAAWCLLAVMLVSYMPSSAQFMPSLGRYAKHDRKDNKIPLQLHKRLYIGGSFGTTIMNAPMSMRVRDTMYATQDDFNDRIGGKEVDTSFTTTARLSSSLSGFLGVSVPVAMTSEKSMLCLDIEGSVLMGELTHDSVTVPLTYTDLLVQESIPFMLASAPISFNFKYGGDASLSKDHQTLLSAGAGIATSYITVDDGSGADPLIKAVPFVKAEVGFVLGVAIKLRGTAYMGNYNLINYQSPELSRATGIISRSYATQLGYNLSIVIMPLSMTWDKKQIR